MPLWRKYKERFFVWTSTNKSANASLYVTTLLLHVEGHVIPHIHSRKNEQLVLQCPILIHAGIIRYGDKEVTIL